MTTSGQPLPAGGRSREEIAQIEVESTMVASGTIRFLLAAFLTMLAVVPIVELVGARFFGAKGSAAAWSRLSGLPNEIRSERDGQENPRLSRLVVSANRIAIAALSGFERALEVDSLLGRALRPYAQIVMTAVLGAGTERAYPGRDGWLFYRPDVEYLTGRGFLDRARLAERREPAGPKAATERGVASAWLPQPDPREAIARFNRDLASRGITLLVLPTPVKPGVHPEQLTRRYARATDVLQNTSYRAFVDGLRRDTVLVFDPSEALAAARQTAPQYLVTDTHWRPETLEAIVEELASFIQRQVRLAPTADPGHRLERMEVRNIGDIARMFDLSDRAPLFTPESVWLRRVLQRDGSPWRSSRDADVLVLGDSFSNIYALESMGWGTSAGFAEQLSYSLQRPVDRLTQNDEGAFATRVLLRQDPGRLTGKRLVIYQFTARELAFGDWKVLALPSPGAGGAE